jgi:hypothetical protein
MPTKISTIRKLAFGFAALFLGVYLLDYVPGIMDQNGLMFGLFHMSRLIDFGHLALGVLALAAALTTTKIARIYFWALGIWYTIDVVTYFIGHLQTTPLKTNVLVNLPHTLIFVAAYWIALKVDQPKAGAAAP